MPQQAQEGCNAVEEVPLFVAGAPIDSDEEEESK